MHFAASSVTDFRYIMCSFISKIWQKKEAVLLKIVMKLMFASTVRLTVRRAYWREKMIWWIKKVQRFVRKNVAASAAELVTLNWKYQIVAWWKRISIINCSLKFPCCSSFAQKAALLCTVPIAFTEITCGMRCYLMSVIETEKELGIIQQHSYWQPQLRSGGLTKNWKSLLLKVVPMALRCYLGGC